MPKAFGTRVWVLEKATEDTLDRIRARVVQYSNCDDVIIEFDFVINALLATIPEQWKLELGRSKAQYL